MPNFLKDQSSLLMSLDLIRSRISPKWAERKIDAHLFMLNTQQTKNIQTPKDFEKLRFNTADGKVNVYQAGTGPTVVLVHGWGGEASQFFSLMRGLKDCGFTALAFDHLGHGKSENKTASIQQMISTTNTILRFVKINHLNGLNAVVGHDIGCSVIVNGEPDLIKDLPLFLISPVFNYKLYFLKKLKSLKLHPNILKQYAAKFVANYDRKFAKFELATNLQKYTDHTVIVHDKADDLSPISDTVKFSSQFPPRKLVVTNKRGHDRTINSESVWQELKSMLNYEDTIANFSNVVHNQN
jgi:predicted alpha/beta-fold hydrolase